MIIPRCYAHPKYRGIFQPRPTLRFPNGCPDCWEVYKYENGPKEDPRERVIRLARELVATGDKLQFTRYSKYMELKEAVKLLNREKP